ncbi:MerR family transcriptional regulator [Prochlorococcus sp. MIT 1223]|uniref:MerR family transcriptional regulator n=1 Tax=Prochlorococcus sp. MIT 1223 TaxID=3096217 RepID=UPI002A74B129|nr:hypothetical protein [Prochlorococcus sp. MIT 1223]
MNESPWLNELEASKKLGVTKDTLRIWREIGYLKPGTHWRSAPSPQDNPWSPKVIYHVRWCKEIIDYWAKEDAPVSRQVA